MLQTSRQVSITLLRRHPGMELAADLLWNGQTRRHRWPSLTAAIASAQRMRPAHETRGIIWAADEHAVAADAVLANDYYTILL